jgi:phosphohistidine phosphatase
MLVYLLRHGEAKPKEQDPERGLTDAGRAEVQAVARALARLKPRIAEIWHSGKSRAEQSARILAASLGIEERVREHEGLAPNDPVQPLVSELRHGREAVAIVGHLPQLGKLVSVLLLGREETLLDLPAAGLVCLERVETGWVIRWILDPQLL